MTARDRFKTLLADALERMCILEEQVETLQSQLAEFKNGVEPERVEEPAA